MLQKVAIALFVALAALVAFVASRPEEWRIARSATIGAPPEAVFAQVDDFRKWAAWSPWEKLDPAMKKTFGGAASGRGAVYSWIGNEQVGQGRQTIKVSEPPRRIVIDVQFLAPWEANNVATFTFAPSGPGTAVEWALEGRNGFVAKAFALVMDIDGMVGKDFEKGLAGLRAVAEAAVTAPAPGTP